LLLRRERGPELRKYIWRLYELGASQSPVLLHEQTDTNWSAFDMAFAAGGERFLVWNGGPKDTNRTIHAYDAASGKELWKAATERTEGDLRVCIDVTGKCFGYPAYAPLNKRLRVVSFSDFGEVGVTAERCEAIPPSGQQSAGDACLFLDGTGKHVVPLVTDWQSLSYVSAFSPNGKLLVWGTAEGVVLVADIQAVLGRLSDLRPSK